MVKIKLYRSDGTIEIREVDSKLERLNLPNNALTDISGLSNLPKLKYLDLSNNNIADIIVLSTLPKLEYLRLYNNDIADISCLSNLPSLKALDLSINAITDIEVLSNLPKLERLYLDNNLITFKKTSGSVDTIIDYIYYLKIGCELHHKPYWLENYKDIGKKHDYTDEQIAEYGKYIKDLC